MTQKRGTGAVLSFTFHNEKNDDLQEIRTDGRYTNIGFDNIDIYKKYRLIIGVNSWTCCKWTELLM